MTDDVRTGTHRIQKLLPYLGAITAVVAVVVVFLLTEDNTAGWLNRFHDLAALVYGGLFGLTLVAAVIAALTPIETSTDPGLRDGLRLALLWSGPTAAYTLLASGLDLPTGEGSVTIVAAVSAYLGTTVLLAFTLAVLRLSRSLRT
ncbi:MAG: hypothetical protein R3320_04950 [Nitriliruptorales bacterium]|nr:hypothetical protein [Nitriliruptorales bacterium]